MSLALAAKHLESQGRNKDSKLVHMTPDELRALNKLSLDHAGKPLSTNPKTGLPEAGFLSSVLPTVLGVAGAAMGLPTWAVIGGVGLAATALTGDIGQGIMAGLGAWSGGKLGADIASASTLAQTGVDTGAKAFNLTADAALKTTTEPFSKALGSSFTLDPVKSFAGQSGIIPTQAAADQMKSFIPSLPSASTASAASAFPSFASAPTALENFSSGAKYAMSNPMQFLKGDGVALNAASALAGPVIGLMGDGLPRYNPAKEEENPFGPTHW